MTEVNSTTVQKYKWKTVGTHKSFLEADAQRNELLSGKDCPPVKVRRCGPEGRIFKVKVGSPLLAGDGSKKPKKAKSKASQAHTSPS